MLETEGPYCPNPHDAKDESCIPRSNFDTFLIAFITVFQVLSGENWNTVMSPWLHARGSNRRGDFLHHPGAAGLG